MLRHRRGHETIDPDNLDGCCDLDLDHGPETTDELSPWVVLFACLLGEDIEPRDWAAVHLRAAEWRNLFPEPA